MPTRLELEALALVLALIAGCVGLYFYDSHEQALGAANITSAVQATTAKVVAADAAKAASVAADQASALHETTSQDAARLTDSRALDALAASMQHGTNRSSGAIYAAAATAAASAASSVPTSGMVREKLYLWAVDRAVKTGEYADCLRSGGQLCTIDYSATVKP